MKDKLIEKLEELVETLTIELISPEPTTFESEAEYSKLNLKEIRLREEIALIESDLAKEEPEKIPVFDSSDISEDDKKNTIDQFIRLTAKHTLQLFMMLGLKTHIEAMVVNEPTKEEFIFSFKKVIKEEPEGVTAEEIRTKFKLETGTEPDNSQGEPDIEYVWWLENRLVEYASSKQIDLRITNDDIEAWADKQGWVSEIGATPFELLSQGAKWGAKAMRNGEIKHLNNLKTE